MIHAPRCRSTVLLAALVLLTSCVPSLHPLYTPADLVSNDALLGTWIDKDNDVWHFERGEAMSYNLTFRSQQEDPDSDMEEDRPAEFDVHLVRLGEHLFLDLYPDWALEGPELRNGLLALHLIAAHTFSLVLIEQDAVQLKMLDPEWLDRALEAGEVEIEHLRRNGDVLLTASTEELQGFVRSIADDPEAFSVEVQLERAPAD